MKQIFVVVAALLAGFVGGVVGTVVTRTRADAPPEKVVRARSFELVNEAGQAISYWGVDSGQNVVLAFGGGSALPGHPSLGLKDPHNQRAAIGVIEDSPFLLFRAPDGETRMSFSLTPFEKPILWMADETGPKEWLGVEQSDTPGPGDKNWALDFGPDRARIGRLTDEEGGQIYVRGLFFVNRDKVNPHQRSK